MENTTVIFGKEFENDFLSGWIKYNRLQYEYSLDALAHGICSTSHLSYFENGKKRLRGEIIEALLKKLNIKDIKDFDNIGLIRQNFYNMMFQIESFNYEAARMTYNELLELEGLICKSPYNIEYRIYQFMFNVFVEEKDYDSLEQDILNIDKIYSSLNKELQHLFMFISGKVIYCCKSHSQGIDRFEIAQGLKETPWTNYYLGFSYCFNSEYLKATYYLEKALDSYEKSGRYINAIWCHNYLGICFSSLKMYEKSESHYKAVLTGAEHFNMKDIYWHIYSNLSHLYYHKGDYDGCMQWIELALKTDGDPLLPIANYIDVCTRLGENKKCEGFFHQYLTKEYESSKYYNYLYFQYLSILHFEETIFYEELTQKILPFYAKINSIEICNTLKIKLIEYLESKRKYKEANKIYKELLKQVHFQ